MLPPKGVSTFQGNFLDPAIQKLLRDFLSDPDRGRLRAPIIDQAYIDIERIETEGAHPHTTKCVDVVLSDMSEPWPLVMGSYYQQSLTRPYNRLMNTSGISFRDHAGSMVIYSPPPRAPTER